jgi:hypothetical protein
MPYQTRILSHAILAFGSPTDPLLLYQQFKEAMSSGLHPPETASELCRTLSERQ